MSDPPDETANEPEQAELPVDKPPPEELATDTSKGQASAKGDADKPLTRNWARGERLEFLTSNIDRYRKASLESRKKATSTLDSIVNEYFAKFHWRLPIQKDLSPDDTYDWNERLSEEDKKRKGKLVTKMRTVCLQSPLRSSFLAHPKQSITNWIQYCAAKIDTSGLSRLAAGSTNDPFAVLLGQLSGVSQKPSKLKSGWQHWMKRNFSPLQPEFDVEFNASGQAESKRATERNRFIMERFSQLPPDIQAFHTTSALKDHEASRDAVAQRRSLQDLTPEQRQAAINRIGDFFTPILEGASAVLGMNITMLFAGPEPERGGQLNVLSLHQGKSLDVVSQTWPLARPDDFRAVESYFLDFVQDCWTVDDQRDAALPGTSVDPAARMVSLADRDEEAQKAVKKRRIKGRARHREECSRGRKPNKHDNKKHRRRRSTESEDSDTDLRDSSADSRSCRSACKKHSRHRSRRSPSPQRGRRLRWYPGDHRFSSRQPGKVQIIPGRWVDVEKSQKSHKSHKS
ncbi:hypothetical protein HGRIS_001650 [Hohenbuehelia grisea]|uniref:Uncharacterized protein n=1 Tax=Hohenbuehelia grisea TaxID=104357 RepID=A0ABR3JJB6_9AGAR